MTTLWIKGPLLGHHADAEVIEVISYDTRDEAFSFGETPRRAHVRTVAGKFFWPTLDRLEIRA